MSIATLVALVDGDMDRALSLSEDMKQFLRSLDWRPYGKATFYAGHPDGRVELLAKAEKALKGVVEVVGEAKKAAPQFGV